MIEKLEKLLEPFANKLAQQRHLQAISSGMMMPLGLIVIGSLFLIVANPPINLDLVDLHTGNIFLKVLISWKQFAVANYDVLTLPYNYTMGLVGLISAFGIAYCLAESYQMKSATYKCAARAAIRRRAAHKGSSRRARQAPRPSARRRLRSRTP